MLPRRRLEGVCVAVAALAAAIPAVWDNCPSLRQLAPAIVLTLPTLVEILTAAIGVWVMMLFWPRHVGRGLHCKRCGYYQEQHGPLAPACPECGAAWLWI